MLNELDSVSVDWSNFEAAGAQTRSIAKRVGTSRDAIARLLRQAESSDELRPLCECHQLLEYVVLYDALDRGFRIRLHLSTSDHLDRPHDHRFSFSSYIAAGSYTHALHEVRDEIYDEADEERKGWISKTNPDPTGAVRADDIRLGFVRRQGAGSCYSLHHSVVHSTITTDDTVSVFIRGPAEKRRSLIFDAGSQTFWWRYGKGDETRDRRNEKVMSDAQFRLFQERVSRILQL